MTPKIKRELRRRAAVEPVIGHLKAEHRMGRNYLCFRQGDATNAVLAAAGYNFRRLIRWLSLPLRRILSALNAAVQVLQPETRVLHGRRVIFQRELTDTLSAAAQFSLYPIVRTGNNSMSSGTTADAAHFVMLLLVTARRSF